MPLAFPSTSVLRGMLLVLAAAANSTMVLPAQEAKDVKGSRDHPMISRIEGSTLRGFDQTEFNEYRLVRGPISGYTPDGQTLRDPENGVDDKNSLRLEGRVWKLTYDVPVNRSTLEIARSYESALSKAGFRILYQCSGKECAGALPKVSHVLTMRYHASAISELLMKRARFNISGNFYEDQRYLAARLERREGDIYTAVLAINLNKPVARVDVIEVKPMETNLVTVNAAAMASEIASRGSVALYGIYFDTDKADVKPESRPTLAEIATLLKQNAALELIVVGHTDNQGTIDYNLELSRRRAEAVVAALVTDFGIARKRLDARGVGFLAPVAPNTTDSDRAKNRRVQLLPR